MSLTRRKFITAGAGAAAAVLLPGAVTGHHRPGHGGPKPTPTPTPTPTSPSPTSTVYGTLMTDSAKAGQEFSAGLRLAGHECFWDRIETGDNTWNTNELSWKRIELERLIAAGLKPVLEPGIHYVPAWVYNLPNARYVSNTGTKAGRNVIWSTEVRARVERYIRKLGATLDLSRYASIRLGGAGDVEVLYPGGSLFWAYDPVAQSRCPLPGWKPGTGTALEADEWYGWYLDEMLDELRWRLGLYRSLGFSGTFHLVMPGIGAIPAVALESIQNRLTTRADVMGRGAAWYTLLGRLADDAGGTAGLMAWCSSTAEGFRQADRTDPNDRYLDPFDPALGNWSAHRLMTYHADRLGYTKGGENPGYGDSSAYGLVMLQAAVDQSRKGGWLQFLWAHDRNLYDGTGPTLAQYSAAIS